jgi:hypothetical protein
MTYIEITDRQGQRRRARPGEVAQDGETFFFPQQFMDVTTVLAEKYSRPAVTDHRPQAGFRRGYALVDTTVSHDARTAAASAYEEKRTRLDSSRRDASPSTQGAAKAYEAKRSALQDAWRKGKQPAAAAPQCTQDAKGLADSAWQEKKARLQNGWRNQ